MHVELHHDTTADPADVWAVVTDLEGSVDTLSGVTAIERLDGSDGFEVGTRWRETRAMFGREASEELVVTAVEPGRSYTVAADNRGTHYTSVLSVEPTDAGARIRMTFGAEQAGRLGRLMARTVGRAFESATRKALEQDLADIAAAAEERSA
jgi:carbon monoxide dehydrogenase subunit G